MSRVAKKPIALPKGVELNIQDTSVSAKGPKGALSLAKPAGVQISVEDGNAVLSARAVPSPKSNVTVDPVGVFKAASSARPLVVREKSGSARRNCTLPAASTSNSTG